MRIPPDVAIKATIRPGSVYYFPEDSFNTEQPHYFIVINKAPLTETLIILVCASSQIDKVRARRVACPPDTLVEIKPEQYSDFRVNSIIDCNYVLEKSIEQLVEKLIDRKLVLKGEMEMKIVEQLREGVLNSSLIENRLKELIR